MAMNPPEREWSPPPAAVVLPPDEVHLWRVDLDQPEATAGRLASHLSADEQRRADGFRSAVMRQRFVVAHGVLRMILGRYAEVEPAALLFRAGRRGKPSLATPDHVRPLHFNLSHAHALALIAVARDRELGVDIERCRPLPDADAVAERFFSLHERAALRVVPPERRLEAFYSFWTCKEAYIKARGDGLTLPLDGFDVALGPGGAAALARTADDPDEAARWSLRRVRVAPGYAAALVAAGHGWQIATWQWMI